MTTLKSMDRDIEVQPLEGRNDWPEGYEPREPEDRKRSQFKADFESTLKLLERELRLHEAEEVVLQLEMPRGQIRKSDGLPYVDADIRPGVVLRFSNEEGDHTYPCDTFTEWKDNLRAIAKVLVDLRRIERYGVGHGSEQYRGFTALPSDVDEQFGPEQAARKIVSAAGYREEGEGFDELVDLVLGSQSIARDYLRKARKKAHPDRDGGTAAEFKRVQTAADVLRQHFEGQATERVEGTT